MCVCVCFPRLQHEVSVLQQQLCESRSLVHSLQCELQVYHRVCGANTNTHSGERFLYEVTPLDLLHFSYSFQAPGSVLQNYFLINVWITHLCLCVSKQVRLVKVPNLAAAAQRPLTSESCTFSWSSSWADRLTHSLDPGDSSSMVSMPDTPHSILGLDGVKQIITVNNQ